VLSADVCLSVCLSSVTLVHPIQTVEIFGNVSTLPEDIHESFFTEFAPGDASVGGFKRKRVANYSDFGPINGYISETVQDRR